MTNYNKLTKAQLIELLHERDSEIAELKQQLKSVEADYDDDVNRLYGRIKSLKSKIKELTNNDDIETFINTYGKLSTKMQIDTIKEEYENITDNIITYAEIYRTLKEMGYKTTNHKKVGHHGYATKIKEGYLYLIQLENERGESIYKIGLTFDFVNRSNTYFKDYKTNIILFRIFKVNDMRKAEFELKEILKSDDRLQLAHGDEFFIGDYKVIEQHYLDVVNRYDGVEESVDNIIARKKSGKSGFKIIKGL